MKRIVAGFYAVLLSAVMVQVAAAQGFPPTEHHELLKKDVGTWHAVGKMYMPGTDEPMEFEGTEVNEMVGDLWVVSDFRGEFAGLDFHGHGRTGYNIETEQFEGTWFDSMTPFVTTMSGQYDEKTNTLTSTSDGRDEMGNPKKGKSTLQHKDENTRILTMYGASPDGGDKWVKELEITYTRQK